MTETAVRTRDLTKRYGDVVALRGVELEIGVGGIVGLVGPNGAGKTTLVEILEGLRRPDGGEVRVLGLDPRAEGERLRERMGVQLQETSLPGGLRVEETARLFAAFYADPRPVADVLRQVGLDGAAEHRVEDLSGGQRQRLALALALLPDPELLVLDEPTAGLDPEGRRALHEDLAALGAEGRTILLTTHYIEEAEKLCDRVLMIRDGEIVADGSPVELTARARGRATLWLAVDGELDPGPLRAAGLEPEGTEGGYHRFGAPDTATALEALRPLLARDGLEVEDLRLRRPTLEDLYLELMGAGGAPPGPGGPEDAP